ncbi:MAG: SLBB domain-containing protein, partial [Pedobacter sp.]
KVFSISGDIAIVGVLEAPLGTTLRELLEMAGGVTGGRFKAAQDRRRQRRMHSREPPGHAGGL